MEICEDSLSRKESIKFFPWIKAVKRRFSKSFPADYDLETLNLFHSEIEKELETVSIHTSKKNEALFSTLISFYNHFCWKIKWRECSPDMKASCAKLLSSLSKVGLVLSKGNLESKWLSQILSAIKVFPGGYDLLYDALLHVNRLKKKFQEAYGVILKNILYSSQVNTKDPSTYFKLMFLYRRLKLLSKKPHERAGIVSLAARVAVPSSVKSWLISHNLEELGEFKRKEIGQLLMKKAFSRKMLEKLRDIILPDASVPNVAVKEESVSNDDTSDQFFIDSQPRIENRRLVETGEDTNEGVHIKHSSDKKRKLKKKSLSASNLHVEAETPDFEESYRASPECYKKSIKSKRKSSIVGGELTDLDSSAKKTKLDSAKKSCKDKTNKFSAEDTPNNKGYRKMSGKLDESVTFSYQSPEEIECIELSDSSDEAQSQSCFEFSSQKSASKSSTSNKKSKRNVKGTLAAGSSHQMKDYALKSILKACTTDQPDLPSASETEVETSVSKKKKNAYSTLEEFQYHSSIAAEGNEAHFDNDASSCPRHIDTTPVAKGLSKKKKSEVEDAIEIKSKEFLECSPNVKKSVKLKKSKRGKKGTCEVDDNSLVEQDVLVSSLGVATLKKKMKRKRHQKTEADVAQSSALEFENLFVVDNEGDYLMSKKNKKRKSKTKILNLSLRDNCTFESTSDVLAKISMPGHSLTVETLLTPNVDETKEICTANSKIVFEAESVSDPKLAVKPVAESDAKLDVVETIMDINTIKLSSVRSDAAKSIVESDAVESNAVVDSDAVVESDAVESILSDAVESIVKSDKFDSIDKLGTVQINVAKPNVESDTAEPTPKSAVVKHIADSVTVDYVDKSDVSIVDLKALNNNAADPNSELNAKKPIVDSNEFEPILVSDEVEPVLVSNEVEPVLISDEVEPVLISDEVEPVLVSDEVEPVLISDEVESVLVSDEVEPVLVSDEVEPVLISDEVDSVLVSDKVRPILVLDEVEPILISDKVEPVLISNEVEPVLVSDEVQPVLNSNEVEPVLASDEVQPILVLGEVEPILISDEVEPVLVSDEIEPVLISDEIEPVLILDEVDPILVSDEVVPVLVSDEVGPILVLQKHEPIIASDEVEPILALDEVLPVLGSDAVEFIVETKVAEPIVESNATGPLVEANATGTVLKVDEVEPNVRTNINSIESVISSQDKNQNICKDIQNSANETAYKIENINVIKNLPEVYNLVHIDSISDKTQESAEISDVDMNSISQETKLPQSDYISEEIQESSIPCDTDISKGFNSSEAGYVSNEIQKSSIVSGSVIQDISKECNSSETDYIFDEVLKSNETKDNHKEYNSLQDPLPTTSDNFNSGIASNVIASSGNEMSQKNSETVEDIAEALYRKILKAKEKSLPKTGHSEAESDLVVDPKVSRKAVDDVAETLLKKVCKAQERFSVKAENCDSESRYDFEVNMNKEVPAAMKVEMVEDVAEAPCLKLKVETLPEAVPEKSAADILTENTVSYVMEKIMKKVEFVNYVPKDCSSDNIEKSSIKCSTEENTFLTVGLNSKPFGFSKEESESLSFVDLTRDPQEYEYFENALSATESKNFFPYRGSLVIDVPDDKSESNFSDVICCEKLEETLCNFEESACSDSDDEVTEVDDSIADSLVSDKTVLDEATKEGKTADNTLSVSKTESTTLESSESNEHKCDVSPKVCLNASKESDVLSDSTAPTEMSGEDHKLISLVQTLQVPVVNLGSRCDIDYEKQEEVSKNVVDAALKSIEENSTADEVLQSNAASDCMHSNKNAGNVLVGSSESLDKQDIVLGSNYPLSMNAETHEDDQNSKDTKDDTSTNDKELYSLDGDKEFTSTRILRKRNVQSKETKSQQNLQSNEKELTPKRSSSRLRGKPTSTQKTESKTAISKPQCRSSKRLKKDINVELQNEFKDLSLDSPKAKRRDPILLDTAAEDDTECSSGGGDPLKVERRTTRSSKKYAHVSKTTRQDSMHNDSESEDVNSNKEESTKENLKFDRRSSCLASVNKFYLSSKAKLDLIPGNEKDIEAEDVQDDSNIVESSQKVVTRSSRSFSRTNKLSDLNSNATSCSSMPLDEESDVENAEVKSSKENSKVRKRSTRSSSVTSEKDSKSQPNNKAIDKGFEEDDVNRSSSQESAKEKPKVVRRSTRTSSRASQRHASNSKTAYNLKPIGEDSDSEDGTDQSSSLDSSQESTKVTNRSTRVPKSKAEVGSVEMDSDGDVRSVVSEGSLKENAIVEDHKESPKSKMPGGRGYSLRSKRSVIMPGKLNILKSDNCP